jgi:hypothetical protein
VNSPEAIYDLIFNAIVVVVAGMFAAKPALFNVVSVRPLNFEKIRLQSLTVVRIMSGIIAAYAAVCILLELLLGKDFWP